MANRLPVQIGRFISELICQISERTDVKLIQ